MHHTPADGYQRVDDTADYRTLSAKDPSHHVEAENADAAPVKGANDYENQGNFIQHSLTLLRPPFFNLFHFCNMLFQNGKHRKKGLTAAFIRLWNGPLLVCAVDREICTFAGERKEREFC